MDFARIMDTLDRRGVSLVSVTQQFNTTTSMGRLTLNILLSFAQFEREIISERTRDKVAAARRKGKWTGGAQVLGYDIARDNGGPRLVVNEAEAEQVRAIFEQYLALGSLADTCEWIDARGWRNKRYTTRKGKDRGGKDFDKSTLQKMPTNRLYLGKVTLKGQVFEGEHEPIVDEDVFGRVQGMLARNRNSGGKFQRNKYGALLKGLVRCKHCGCAMNHHFATRGNRRYRYYVCQTAQQKGWAKCPYPSLPAGELERFVVERIMEATRDPALLAEVVGRARSQIDREIEALKERRARHERRARRLNEDLCELTRVPDAPGTGAELASVQDDLVKVEKSVVELNRRIVELEARRVDEDECVGAFEAFEPMWDRLRPAEKGKLIHLLVQCIEYDGEGDEIAITYHPVGLETLSEVEAACDG
jgi:site-specific DNA recombinase